MGTVSMLFASTMKPGCSASLKGQTLYVHLVYFGSSPKPALYRLCSSSSAAQGLSVLAHLTSIVDMSSSLRIFVPEECLAMPFTSPCLILQRRADALPIVSRRCFSPISLTSYTPGTPFGTMTPAPDRESTFKLFHWTQSLHSNSIGGMCNVTLSIGFLLPSWKLLLFQNQAKLG